MNETHVFHVILQITNYIYCKVSYQIYKKTDSDFVLLTISDFLTFAVKTLSPPIDFFGPQSFLISGR